MLSNAIWNECNLLIHHAAACPLPSSFMGAETKGVGGLQILLLFKEDSDTQGAPKVLLHYLLFC